MLQPVAKERYIRRLGCLYGGLGVPTDIPLCPYDDITDDQWADDVSQWPTVEFGHLYLYFVETPGGYTQEALRHIKVLRLTTTITG